MYESQAFKAYKEMCTKRAFLDYSYFDNPTQIFQILIKDDPEELAQLLIDDSSVLNTTFIVYLGLLNILSVKAFCCYFRAIKCMDVLENFGINFRTPECIIAAAAGGSIDVFRRLNISKKDIEKVYYFSTPAITATIFGNIDILKYIYSKINLDLEKNYIQHPIMYAAQYGQIDCMKFIIDSTNVKYIKPKVFKSVCMAAIRFKSDNSLALLYEKFPKYRYILKDFVMPCDSPYLFRCMYNTKKINAKITSEIIKSESIKILQYLLSIGAEIYRTPNLFKKCSNRDFLKLFITIDPRFYYKIAFEDEVEKHSGLDNVFLAAKKVDSFSQEEFFDLVKISQYSHCYNNLDKVYAKVPKDQEFQDKLFAFVLQKNQVRFFDDCKFMKSYNGDATKLLGDNKPKLPDKSIVYLWKRKLITLEHITPENLANFDFSSICNLIGTDGFRDKIMKLIGPKELFIWFIKEGRYNDSLARQVTDMRPELVDDPQVRGLVLSNAEHFSFYIVKRYLFRNHF